MRKTIILGAVILVSMLLACTAFAQTSVQLKRTNPGIAGIKSAELIFSVANMDMTHKMEGFILCRSPDDAIISSTLGASIGTGAQYLSPLFIIDKGPAEKSMSLTIDSDTEGDKEADCTFKYIAFKETVSGKTETKDVTYTDAIGTSGTDVSGFTVTLTKYTEAVEATNETEAVPAKATIDVDGIIKEIEVGKSETIKTLAIKVSSATADGAQVEITGTKTVTAGESVKQYKKPNGEYIGEELKADEDYSLIRLDKTVPFVTRMKSPQCPAGTTSCKASEVMESGVEGKGLINWFQNNPIWIVLVIIVIGLAYVLGKAR